MKRLLAIVFVILASCSTPELNNNLQEVENLERRPETVVCGTAEIPDNRQDVIDRLNSTGEIVNGFSEREVIINYDKNRSAVMFGHLITNVQYNFTITDNRSNETNGCITVTSAYSTFYDFRGRTGTYTLTFDDYPEVTRNYEFEITRGR